MLYWEPLFKQLLEGGARSDVTVFTFPRSSSKIGEKLSRRLSYDLSYGARGSVFQSAGADPPLLKCRWGGGGRLLGVVGLWTFKMVYLVSTQYFLIQLQRINLLF